MALDPATKTEQVATELVATEPAAVMLVAAAPAETAVTAATLDITFGIHGSRVVGTTLIPTLSRVYANAVGADFEIIETDDPAT